MENSPAQCHRPCTDAIELSAQWNFDRKFLQHDRFTTQERPLRGYPSKGVPPVPSLSKCDLWQASCARAWTQPVDLLAKFAHTVFSRCRRRLDAGSVRVQDRLLKTVAVHSKAVAYNPKAIAPPNRWIPNSQRIPRLRFEKREVETASR